MSEPGALPAVGAQSRDRIINGVGVAVLLAFAAFIFYLLSRLDLREVEWTRAMVLFGGVEAVAFAAAGYFFGTQVQRGKAQEAEAAAQAARSAAEAAIEVVSAERRASGMLALGVLHATDGADGLVHPDGLLPPALLEQARSLLGR